MKRRIITTICVVFVVLVCATFSTVSANKTNITNNNGELVSSNTTTTNELNSYIATLKENNVKIAKTKAPSVKITITFSKSMAYEDLTAFINAYDINVVQLQARGYDKDNKRITFFSKTDLGLQNTFYMLEKSGESDNVVFSGIIGMYAYINAGQILDAQADENVLLLDTSSDINYKKITQNNISGSDNAKEEENKEFANSIAWEAEDMGLVLYY